MQALKAVETTLHTLSELTSKFYTTVPHSFGDDVPPVIVNKEMLQREFEMLK